MMAGRITSDEPILRTERTFAAPRDRVYRAWTDAGELARWFAPGDDYVTEVLELGLVHFILTHELFPTQQMRDEHSRGWSGCLDRLTRAI